MAGSQFVATLFVLFTIRLAHAEFTNSETPFRDASTPDVTFVSSDRAETRIKFLEERLAPIRIAIMEYTGDTFPEITDFEEGKTNQYLGAVGEKDADTWYLVITLPQDFENPTQKTYGFYVDTGIGGRGHLVTLAIENINDNPPVISALQNECKMEENRAHSAQESNCTFSVLDRDGGADNIVYSVANPNFNVEAIVLVNDFTVTVALSSSHLDFEEFSLYILNIEATDEDGEGLSGSTSYVVQVLDVADTPPVWTSPIIPQTIPEESATSVQVKAIDGDIGINARIAYELQNENGTYFSIDYDTGLISIASINRDVLDTGTFTFLVVAFEVDDPDSNINDTMTVIVEDINDNVPTITADSLPMAIDVLEATPVSLDLGIQVNDPDLGDFGQFDIRLEDNSMHGWNELFLLIPNSGYRTANVDISVQSAAALDYEDVSMREIRLQLVASEQKDPSRSTTQEIVITLVDVNDESPLFDEETYVVTIPENIEKAAVVATVRATDADAGDVVTHSFSSVQKALTIDPTTGVITTTIDNAFDYERQTEILVQVVAEDLVGHKSFAQLTINVDDVNDTPPILDIATTLPTVAENSEVDTLIEATISATDEDTDALVVFSIDWFLSSATKQGARVQDTAEYEECIEIRTIYPDLADMRAAVAELYVKEDKLDYEIFDTLSLRIVASDENTLESLPLVRFRSATLSIQILDENDNAPQFTADSQNARWTVFENSGTDQLIGTVVAIDADGAGNNNVQYSMDTADPNLPDYLVKIDPDTGVLRVNLSNEITCDTTYGDQMTYNVTASDGTHETILQISIGIIDMNDKTPQHNVTDDEYTILENSPTGTYITSVGATDADFTQPFHTVSFFIDGKKSDPGVADLFSLDENTGYLQVKLNEDFGAELDRDAGITFYQIEIIFRDNYQQGSNSPVSLSNDTKITVFLDDVNDNAPVFPIVEGYLAEPLEDVKAGTIIKADIYAPDADAGDNARVEYTILSCEKLPGGSPLPLPDNMFTIETTADSKGNIRANVDLQDLWGEYDLELKAEDFGPVGYRQNSTMTYTIHVVDKNDKRPEIVYPVESESIRLKEDQSVGAPLLDKNNQTISLFRATDEDSLENGLVLFEIVGNDAAKEYFTIVNNYNGENNVGQLQLKKELVPEAKHFQLEITATDNGTPPLFDFVNVTLVIVKTVDVEPQFTQRTWDVTFMENSISETATLSPPAIDENNDFLDVDNPEWDDIFYYLIDDKSPGLPFFSLDKITGTLTLAVALDREEYMNHTFHVLASNLPNRPDNVEADAESPSQLVLHVTVGDEDDSPPKFDMDLWPGGISTGDRNGQIIMKIIARDPDEITDVTYLLLQETMVADPSLANVKDTAFILEPISGDLVLNFDPDNRMSGYFEFQVEASDVVGGENHTANATVKIFIITDANRVVFTFLNDKDEVSFMRLQMMQVFTETIGHECTIDAIVKATDSSGMTLERETDVTTHFIDTEANEPVDNSAITQIVTNREKITEMKRAFINLEPYPLELTDYDPGTTLPPKSYEDLLRIILIVVSVVLGTLLILLFAAFFIKTRSLNRRLEALSTTKFGSQDSGLNRVGMSAPGANKRAIEGSNPVWGEDLGATDYDNISQGSYDSDLIGVEESPEFNSTTPVSPPGHYLNGGYDADDVAVKRVSSAPEYQHGGDVPRLSINPLSNGGTPRGSSQVNTDSQLNGGNNYRGGENYVDDSNFTFSSDGVY